jgi:TolB-like protein/DNA-binding winged helix-turn-helix (wHTH) protein/tetratricopeptide (TPR) repeat protein
MAANLVEFGVFDLGRPLKLERIPMEVLFLLVERRGQLVAREEIIARIWGKDVFLDTDNGINSAIRKIRMILRDDPEHPVYVQTISGKGYRFIAEVREVNVPQIPFIPATSPAIEPNAISSAVVASGLPVDSSPKLRWAVPLLCLVMVLATGVMALWIRSRTHIVAEAHRVRLAVLPFANLSHDPEQEYFSDGLTEETISDLGEINPEQLAVIARTSSTAYKHTTKTITEIGQELGVDFVLEGSVRREGGATRITAQLIRVKDQVHLWAHNYDRDSGGILALQNELGRAIAQQVQVQLTTPYGRRSARKYIPNPEAYELYLKGRFYLNKRTWPEIDESVVFFQHAIEKDPGFALAYGGLADSYLANSIGDTQEFDPMAKKAAARALELDDNLAEAHTVLGAVKADFEFDWAGAEQEFRRAIENNPNDAEAHYLYSWHYLTPLGKSDQAIAEMKKALDLDPFSRIDNTVMGMTYFYAGREDDALQQLQKAVTLNPDFFVTYYHLSWVYSQRGQYPEAIAMLSKGRLLAGDNRVKIAASDEVALRKAFAEKGAQGFWQEMQREGMKDDPEIGEFGMPQLAARLGDKQKALEGLEHNFDERSALATLVNIDPAFDSLHSDPRFENLVRRMGLNSKSIPAQGGNR